MSSYNMMFGVNPIGPALLNLLAIDPRAVPRLRDAYLYEDGDERVICVLTRTGGNNRSIYTRRPGAEEQGQTNDYLTDHPLFVRTFDARSDSTMARFLFRIPETFREVLDGIPMDTQVDYDVRMDRFKADMDANRETDDTRRAQASFAPLIEKIKQELGLDGGTGT